MLETWIPYSEGVATQGSGFPVSQAKGDKHPMIGPSFPPIRGTIKTPLCSKQNKKKGGVWASPGTSVPLAVCLVSLSCIAGHFRPAYRHFASRFLASARKLLKRLGLFYLILFIAFCRAGVVLSWIWCKHAITPFFFFRLNFLSLSLVWFHFSFSPLII